MDKEPYYVHYVASLGFVGTPDWLEKAVKEKKVVCNHPETVQDI